MTACITMQPMLHGSLGILVFWSHGPWWKSNGVIPSGGPNTVGRKIYDFQPI